MNKSSLLERIIARLGLILSVIYLVTIPFVFYTGNSIWMAIIFSSMAIICTIVNVTGIAHHFLKPEQSEEKYYRLIILNTALSLVGPVLVFFLTLQFRIYLP